MFKARRKFSEEFKRRVVEEAKQPGAVQKHVAQANDLNEGVLRRWVIQSEAKEDFKPKVRRQYTPEFKQKMVEEFLKSNMGAKAFSQGRGFSDTTIRQWAKEMGHAPVPVNGKPKLANYSVEESQKITQFIGRLVMRIAELDPAFLDKALRGE